MEQKRLIFENLFWKLFGINSKKIYKWIVQINFLKTRMAFDVEPRNF